MSSLPSITHVHEGVTSNLVHLTVCGARISVRHISDSGNLKAGLVHFQSFGFWLSNEFPTDVLNRDEQRSEAF